MIETNNMSLWHLSYTKNNLSDALKFYPTESNFWPFQQITQVIDIEFRYRITGIFCGMLWVNSQPQKFKWQNIL